MRSHRVLTRTLAASIAAMALLGACGGDDSDVASEPTADASTTTTAAPAATTTPTYAQWVPGSMAQSGRLSCIGGIDTFEATSAPVGETLDTYPSADAAVAAEIEGDEEATDAKVVGPEEKGTRYVLYDAEGTAIEEVVVGDTSDGLRVVVHDTCG
jgi:hypothetical protein